MRSCQTGLTVIAVAGDSGRTAAAVLIKELLERTEGARVELADAAGPEPRTLLRRLEDAGCTHVLMKVSPRDIVQGRTAGCVFDLVVSTGLARPEGDEARDAERLFFQRCGWAVLDLDDGAGGWRRDDIPCPVFTYSENKSQADLSARNIRLFPSHVEFEALTLGGISRVYLPIPGGFSIYNALAALAAGLCLGLELEEMARAMPSVRGMRGRVEVVPVPRAYTVIIDFARTPNALEKILTTARAFTAGKLICVFGCPGGRDRARRPLMGAVAGELADAAVITSDDPRGEDPRAIIGDILAGMEEGASIHVEPDRRAAIGWALSQGRPGDVIVLAGKGRETCQEIGGVRYPMDEREIVAEWFQRTDTFHKMSGKVLAGVI